MPNIPVLNTPEAKEAASAVAAAFGIDAEKAQPAIESLATAVNARMIRSTLSRGGIADLVELLADKSAGRAMDGGAPLSGPETIAAGNHVLDVLIGNKHVSRGIAASTARDTGIDVETAKKLLPVVASMMVGSLQRTANSKIEKAVQDVPALRAMGKSPLPIPGDKIPGIGDDGPAPSAPDNPFDNLPDIVRRGRVNVPNGGSLESIIRSIVGSLLGNKNRGVIGTLIQAMILRWLVNLARRFFSRVAVGR